MLEQGVIFDLEGILLTIDMDENAKNQMVFEFLRERKYVFHPDDLEGKSPLDFAASFARWRDHDREILEQEIGKFERRAMMNAKGDPSASGVLEMISRRYRVVVLSRSRGDGLVKTLGKLGIRQFIHSIVPAEDWVNHPSPVIGLELAMAKYPEIPKGKWRYVGLPDSRARAHQCDLAFYPFGIPPLKELEDVMDELL
ncbi:MAG: hypothetical protein U0M15_05455 [Bacillota bacterium]|nr:hypothetical protein [Bacillota bacterium]